MNTNVTDTEDKIYNSAAVGRSIKDRIISEAKKRGLECGHSGHSDMLWKSDVWIVKENKRYCLEIKVCNTSGGTHKNCCSPFKNALGCGVSWKKRGFIPSFLFLDGVSGANGTEHDHLVEELESFGIKTKVIVRIPRDKQCADLLEWML